MWVGWVLLSCRVHPHRLLALLHRKHL
jgi:hypothetical protein